MKKKLLNFFHAENSIRGASFLLVITLALSNILGLFRDHFLARYISTANLDIYFAAFRIPDLVFNFLILGAIYSAIVPIFSEYRTKDDLKSGWHIVNSVLNIAAVAMIISAVVIFFLMPFLVKMVVPNFSPERMQLTVKLSRILMLTPIFFSISYILSGVLNSYNRFVAYSIAPLLYNLSIIIGVFTLGRSNGILGVVYFVVIGSVLHLLVQIPSAIKLGYQYKFIFNVKHEAVIRIFKLMIPRTIGLGIGQILLFVYTSIASSLQTGSISAFNFANNIQTVPTVVFGSSLATAVFPTLTYAASKSDDGQFCFYISRSIRTISYLLIPLSAILYLLRAQIIRLILGSGQFAWSDTTATAAALGFFALSLLPQGLVPLFARAFFAVKDTKTPMFTAIISALAGILAAYWLAPIYGVGGLALAFGVYSYINAILLYFRLGKISCYQHDNQFSISLIKTIFITFIMAVILQTVKIYLSGIVDMKTFFGVLEQTVLTFAVAASVYILLSIIFKCQELGWAIKRKVA